MALSRVSRIALAASLLACAGCVSYREGFLATEIKWPPSPLEERPSISLALTLTHNAGGVGVWPGNQLGEGISTPLATDQRRVKGARTLYEESGLFKEVHLDGRNPDLRVELEFVRDDDGSYALALLWACTLGCAPLWWSEDLTLLARFRDGEGKLIGTSERYERETTWMWIPGSGLMVFSSNMPSDPNPELSPIMKDLIRATLVDAREKGFLNR